MTLAELVEKVGKCQQYWQKHASAWTDAEWLQRRKKLLLLMEEMEERLAAATGSVYSDPIPIEEFGWTLAADNQWKRLGAPDPPPRISEEMLKKEFPEFWRAKQREAKEEQQPALTMSGDTVGYTPF